MTVRLLLFTDVVDSTDSSSAWATRARRSCGPSTTAARATCSRSIAAARSTAPTASSCCSTQPPTPPRFALGYHEALAELGAARAGRPARRPGHAARERADDVARGAKPRRGRRPRQAARRARDGAGARRADAAQRRGARGARRRAASTRRADRRPRPLPAQGHRRAGRGLRARRVRGAPRSRRRPTPTRRTASCASATCGGRCARSATTCRPSATPSSAAARSCARSPQRLDAGARLVTVLGPGGTGKTRLVRRYGQAWLGDWPGGVYFCDLSEARSLDGIHFAVALRARRAARASDDAGVQLGHAIAGARPLPGHPRQLRAGRRARRRRRVGRWLDRAPEAAFVVTSRERLHLPGEEVCRVEPLPLDDGRRSSCSSLRARAQRPDFALDDGQPRRRGRGRAPARRPAAGDRARGGARARAVAGAARRAAARPLRAARRRARRRGAPGDAAGGDRLVVGPARAVGAGGAARSARCSRAASRSRRPRRCSTSRAWPDAPPVDRRGAGARRQEPAARLGARSTRRATTSTSRTSACT